MPAVWPFLPQDTFTETMAADVRVTTLGPRSESLGRQSADLIRGFRTSYSLVASSDVASMAAFFEARHGAFQAFDFVNPNDRRVYAVRFDAALRLEMFTPAFFRSGGELVFTVCNS